MEIKIISQKEVEELNIPMSEVISVVESGLKSKGEGSNEMPAKTGIHPRQNSFIHAMPCWVGGNTDYAGIKWVSGYPANPSRGLPYIMGIWCLNDPETGMLKAIMDANWMTAWRTGAASGVCAKYLADPASDTIAIIGLGVQARTNLMAMNEVLKNLKIVKVYDIFDKQIEKFTTEMSKTFPHLRFISCKDTKETVSSADVIITCTPVIEKPEPSIKAEWLKNDVLTISVDHDAAYENEVMTEADIFVCDDINQYLWMQNEKVSFHHGYPVKEKIYADMGQVVAGKKEAIKKGRRSAVLMGIACHDVMTGHLIYKKAEKAGIGVTVNI